MSCAACRVLTPLAHWQDGFSGLRSTSLRVTTLTALEPCVYERLERVLCSHVLKTGVRVSGGYPNLFERVSNSYCLYFYLDVISISFHYILIILYWYFATCSAPR